MKHPSDISARPLLIGGMHRSGTSLTASLFADAGMNLGPTLLGANDSNPAGHFEDIGIQDFHIRALVAQGLGGEGYTAAFAGTMPPALEPEAADLIATRMRPGAAWGWKEPRTTLFLDFWQERLPQARHVFVFRRPWEVADSLFRRGDPTFIHNPMFAFDVWTHYNRLILDFVHRHPAQCVVFEISQVIAEPDRVFAAVRSRLDVPLDRPKRRYRDDLFTRDDTSSRAAIARSVAPEAWRTYLGLRDLAGVADDVDALTARDASLGDCAVLEWARASRAETQARKAVEAEARLRAEHEKERKSRGSLTIALRESPQMLLAGIAAASRRLRTRPRPEVPAGLPDLRPFPREEEAPATRRAA